MAEAKAAAAPQQVGVGVRVVAHLLFLGIAILMVVWPLCYRGGLAFQTHNKQKLFNMHPLFTVLGFVLLSGEAMIVYKSNWGSRKQQKAVHGALNLAGLVCGSIGVAAIFKYHNDLHLSNMYTLHSWFGISTLSFFALQLIIGFASFVFPRVESSSTRAKVSSWHIMLGLVIFSMAILTSLTGLTERFMFLHLNRSSEGVLINFTALLIFLFGVSVFTILLQRYFTPINKL